MYYNAVVILLAEWLSWFLEQNIYEYGVIIVPIWHNISIEGPLNVKSTMDCFILELYSFFECW